MRLRHFDRCEQQKRASGEPRPLRCEEQNLQWKTAERALGRVAVHQIIDI